MYAYILFTAMVLLISFLAGIGIFSLFKINFNKYDMFIIPIGHVEIMAVLYPFYYIFTMFVKDDNNRMWCYIISTIVILLILAITGLINIRKFSITSFFKRRKWEIIISLIAIIVGIATFLLSKYDYRLDDINFYGPYIQNRMFEINRFDPIYDCESYFIFYSLLVNLYSLYFVGLQIGFIFNVPGFINIIISVLTLMGLNSLFKDHLKNKNISLIITVTNLIIFYLDYWNTSFMHMSTVSRIMPLTLLLVFLVAYTNNSYHNRIFIATLVGSFISINSSAFFLSMIIIYSYLIYALINKTKGYIKDALAFTIYPLSFAIVYINNYGTRIWMYLVLLYLLFVVLALTNIDEYIEGFLNKFHFGTIILLLVPTVIITAIYLFNIPSMDKLLTLTNRNFFDNINGIDMVPDLFNIKKNYFAFNIIFWIFLIIYIIKNKGFKKFTSALILATIITFYNPLVYRFVVSFLTGVAYWRIAFIIYNPVTVGLILCSIFNMINNNTIILLSVILIAAKAMSFNSLYINFDYEDYNFPYHITQSELNVITYLDNIYMNDISDENIDAEKEKNEFINDGKLKVASHIYGLQLFTKSPSENALEDRFSYAIINSDEFEQVFARRIPGYDLPEVNYEKACSLAYSRKLDYVVIDAQYNWELQTGLWPCSYQAGEDFGTYRILKMDYQYWNYNISQGYTNLFDLNQQ